MPPCRSAGGVASRCPAATSTAPSRSTRGCGCCKGHREQPAAGQRPGPCPPAAARGRRQGGAAFPSPRRSPVGSSSGCSLASGSGWTGSPTASELALPGREERPLAWGACARSRGERVELLGRDLAPAASFAGIRNDRSRPTIEPQGGAPRHRSGAHRGLHAGRRGEWFPAGFGTPARAVEARPRCAPQVYSRRSARRRAGFDGAPGLEIAIRRGNLLPCLRPVSLRPRSGGVCSPVPGAGWSRRRTSSRPGRG
jgi:hypothetical protein